MAIPPALLPPPPPLCMYWKRLPPQRSTMYSHLRPITSMHACLPWCCLCWGLQLLCTDSLLQTIFLFALPSQLNYLPLQPSLLEDHSSPNYFSLVPTIDQLLTAQLALLASYNITQITVLLEDEPTCREVNGSYSEHHTQCCRGSMLCSRQDWSIPEWKFRTLGLLWDVQPWGSSSVAKQVCNVL